MNAREIIRRNLSVLRAYSAYIPGVDKLNDDDFFDIVVKAEETQGSNNFWNVLENYILAI